MRHAAVQANWPPPPTNKPMTQALYFIVKSIAHLYVLLFLLRFWLPFLRANFRNPIAQGILRFTSPLIVPVRRFIPPLGRIDTATVLVTLVIECVVVFVLFQIVGRPTDPAFVAIVALSQLAILSLHLFSIAIFARVILSWIGQQTYHPLAALAGELSEPIMRPFRRVIPPLGGIDFSPMVALILLQATVILIQAQIQVRL